MLKTKHAFTRRNGIILLLLATFFIRSNDVKSQSPEPYTWRSVAIGGGGFVSGIVTEKRAGGKIYARTDVGGAYRYEAAYKKWIPLTDFASDSQQGIFGVESIAIDHSHPNIIYMSAGIPYFNDGKSYILRSTDYGDSFSVTEVTSQFKINGNGYGRQDGERLQVDPLNGSVLYCGSRANGLFTSKNAGAKWKRLGSLDVSTTPNGNGVNFVVLDTTFAGLVNGARQTLRLFVGISRAGIDNLYWSKDGGISFAPLVNPMLTDKTLMPHRGVLSGGYLYITYSNGAGPGGTPAEPCTTGQLWRYQIATGTWANVSPVISGAAQAKPFCGLSIDPLNPSRIVVSTTNNYSFQYNYNGKGVFGDKIYYTADGGLTWADITANGFSINANGMPWIMGQSMHWAGSVAFDPSDARRVFAVSGNGVFVNNDIAVTPGVWDFAAKGIEETVPQNIISIPDGPIVSVISDYDGFTQADPAQYAPNRHIPSVGSTNGLAYASASKKVVRLSNAMYYSNDEGKTWLKANGSLSAPRGQVALSADGRVFLHCPAGSAVTYRSTDNGANWHAVAGLNSLNARPVADGLNPDKFYIYDNGTVMLSTDGGQSFKSASDAGTGGSKIIRTIPGKEGHLWVALLGGGLAYSEDSGKSFKNVSKVSYCGAVGIGKAQMPGRYETIFIYGTVRGVLGVHRSTDKGATWKRINDDKHQYGGPGNGQFIQGDMNVFGRVYMSTAGRGIVYGSISPDRMKMKGQASD